MKYLARLSYYALIGTCSAGLFLGCSIKDDKSSGIIDETESQLTGSVISPSGKPLVGARVMLHGEGVSSGTQALAKTSEPGSFHTVEVKTDNQGHYKFNGNFYGKVYLEIDYEDSLGYIDSIDFDTDKESNRDECQVAQKGIMHLETGHLEAGIKIWIPSLNKEILVIASESMVNIKVPPGHYQFFIINGTDSTESSGSIDIVEQGTTPVIPGTVGDTTQPEPEQVWIAKWEFNNSKQIGEDLSGNAHHAVTAEGAPILQEDSLLSLDNQSGLRVPLSSQFRTSAFTIETQIFPTSFGALDNIVVTEPPGNIGDGWILRLENGKVVFLFRDSTTQGSQWESIQSSKLQLNQWVFIRVVVSAQKKALQINGVTVDSSEVFSNVSDLNYDIGIGYDAVNQAIHDRYFSGKIDYIRIHAGLKTTTTNPSSSSSISITSSLNISSSVEMSSSSEVSAPSSSSISSSAVASSWTTLAAWEFNDNTTPLLDNSGNGHTGTLGAGTITLAGDTALNLDDASGFYLPLGTWFQRNDFRVSTRIFPTSFEYLDNIIVTEPPGSYYDGWILRLQDGRVSLLVRDDSYGVWNTIQSEVISLNEWTTIEVERLGVTTSLWVNGTLIQQAQFAGDIGQLQYEMGIGYDAVNQGYNDRYFSGLIDYIRLQGK